MPKDKKKYYKQKKNQFFLTTFKFMFQMNNYKLQTFVANDFLKAWKTIAMNNAK